MNAEKERVYIGLCESLFAELQSERDLTKGVLDALKSMERVCVSQVEAVPSRDPSRIRRLLRCFNLIGPDPYREAFMNLDAASKTALQESAAMAQRIRDVMARAELVCDQTEAGLANMKRALGDSN